MRLSDAIALGRTLTKQVTANLFYDNGCACARGMACLAVGKEAQAGKIEKEIWPWLNNRFEEPCQCGEGCGKSEYTQYYQAWGIINHLMFHVVGCKDNRPFPQTWTLDELIDWVRSVEPPEPEVAGEESIVALVAQEVPDGN